MGAISSVCGGTTEGYGCLNPFSKRHVKLLVVGSHSAGKTTLIEWLSGCRVAVGFPPDTTRGPQDYPLISWRDVVLDITEIGGDVAPRAWSKFYPKVDGVIFVLDSCDEGRLDGGGGWGDGGAAKTKLRQMLSDETLPSDTPVLILANKQDSPDALSIRRISARLGLHKFMRGDRRLTILGGAAHTGLGVNAAMEWLTSPAPNTDLLGRRKRRRSKLAAPTASFPRSKSEGQRPEPAPFLNTPYGSCSSRQKDSWTSRPSSIPQPRVRWIEDDD